MMGHKHPEYEYLYEWADRLNIEEWRVDSMIDRVGKDKEKLRRQKKLPWLYKKGRKKYRLFIGWWLELEGFLDEAQYVLDWKPKQERDKPPKKEERVHGYYIFFEYDDYLRPPKAPVQRLEDQYLQIHISQKDLWKDPRDIRAGFLVQVLNDHFVHNWNLPLLGGRIDWDNESWNTLVELGDRLKDKGVDFPDCYETVESGNPNYVYFYKSWTEEDLQILEDEGAAFGVLVRKQQVLWPDGETYLKCPWTWDQLDDWEKKDFRKYKGFNIIDREVRRFLDAYYYPGYHIVKWWRVKYCKPDDNDIANWIHNERSDTKNPLELYKLFRRWLHKQLNNAWARGIQLGFLGVTFRGGATPFNFYTYVESRSKWAPLGVKENLWKGQLEFYIAELENRNPMHLAFNRTYEKYIKKTGVYSKQEFTGFGDIRFVTDIPPDDDGLKESAKKNTDLELKTCRNTLELIGRINRLKHLLSKHRNPSKLLPFRQMHLYDGSSNYPLDNIPVLVVYDIKGTVGESSMTFKNEVDYRLVSDSVEWLSEGRKPDLESYFLVSYIAHRKYEPLEWNW